MKVAVVGAGPKGKFFAQQMSELGSYVTLFDGGGFGKTAQFLHQAGEKTSLDESSTVRIKKAWVTQIHKRFLQKNETIPDRSRLHDLFRLTYKIDPGVEVEKRIEENPEVFEKLGQDVLDSLKNQAEAFEDFDIVIDARGPFQECMGMGAGGSFVLNEKALASLDHFVSGREGLHHLTTMQEKKSITLVGHNILCLKAMVMLGSWLEKSDHELNIITYEDSCFSELFSEETVNTTLREEGQNFIKKYLDQWKSACEEKREELQAWRALESHEKAKISMPEIPEPKLKVYEGYNVTSIDKLLDREELFLTLELAPWKNPNQDKQDILTVKQDFIWSTGPFRVDTSVTFSLNPDQEPGFYQLETLSRKENLLQDADLFEFVKQDLMQFFSRT